MVSNFTPASVAQRPASLSNRSLPGPLAVILLVGLGVVTSLALVSWPLIWLAALGSLALVVLSFFNFEAAVWIPLLVLPFDFQREISPGTYIVSDLLPLLLVPAFVMRYIKRVDKRFLAFMLLFPLFALVTGWYRAENPPWFYKSLLRLVTDVIFASMVATVVKQKGGFAKILPPILWASLLVGAYSVFQVIIDDFGLLWHALNSRYLVTEFWQGRATGLFIHPNNLGGYTLMVLALLMGGFSLKEVRGKRLLMALSWLLMLLALLLSGSRGAWIGFIMMVAFLMFIRFRGGKITIAAALVALLCAYIIFQHLPVLSERSSLDELTVSSRMDVYAAAWILFLRQPIIGIGFTNFREVMRWTVSPSGWMLTDFWKYAHGVHQHNIYLWILSECGIIGFLLFYGPILFVLVRCIKRSLVGGSPYTTPVAAAIFATLVHGMFDLSLDAAAILQMFFVLVGMGFAVSQSQLSRKAAPVAVAAMAAPLKMSGYRPAPSPVELAHGPRN